MVFPKALLITFLFIGSLLLVIIWNSLCTEIEVLTVPPNPAHVKTSPPSKSSNQEKSIHIMRNSHNIYTTNKSMRRIPIEIRNNLMIKAIINCFGEICEAFSNFSSVSSPRSAILNKSRRKIL